MTRVRLLCRTTAALATATVVPGCQLGSHTTAVERSTTTTTVVRHPTPGPTKTIVRNYQTLQAGQTGELFSRSQHAGLDINVGQPAVSHDRLSTTHGYPPQHGSFVTFKLTIRNIGKVPVLISRLDFYVDTQGASHTTTDDGNSPVSGSESQLDSTQLSRGEHLTNYLTFDVAHTSGTFFYAPHHDKSLAWRF
ncbi:MAG: DUF4352 domain-containing protein [Frankiaceae bacterium]|nr:DUF4352 domain-containing protein [Frankiaceae bacterium]MBV9872451.1 DUF4352 domain-containing protein [Frankiaceae bacterium]